MGIAGLITATGGITASGISSGAITATSVYSSGAMTINSGGLDVTGMLIADTITASGAITCSSQINALSFNSTSDYRVKQFVQPITNASINSLNPVSYYNILSNKTDLGFIAHEVQPHFPMLVNGEKDGVNYQSINYIGLIPVLVAEIKELKSQVKILNSKVEQLMHNESI